MTQTEAAQELRDLADKLAASGRQLALPREQYTLAEAHAVLRAAIPKPRSINLELSTWNYGFDDEIVTEWKVYDGKANHSGATLTGAVNTCLAANREPQSEPLAVAEAVIVEAQVPADDDVLAALAIA